MFRGFVLDRIARTSSSREKVPFRAASAACTYDTAVEDTDGFVTMKRRAANSQP
jgi:hypothetical protein